MALRAFLQLSKPLKRGVVVNKKFLLVVFVFMLVASSGLFAQQITRFAVVDTARIYQAYFRTSAPVRSYETKKESYQAEIDSLTQELQQLHEQKLAYDKANDALNSARLQAEITKKADYLNEFANAKNAELESLKSSLQSNDEFYQNLYATLEKVAESGGYSVVMSLQQANAILWYSPSVDITDEVIKQLGL
jgi:outer membrane protein